LATTGWTATAGTPTAAGTWATAKAGTSTATGTIATSGWTATEQTFRQNHEKNFVKLAKISFKKKSV
jgi:hypothetical protein